MRAAVNNKEGREPTEDRIPSTATPPKGSALSEETAGAEFDNKRRNSKRLVLVAQTLLTATVA